MKLRDFPRQIGTARQQASLRMRLVQVRQLIDVYG